MDTSEVFGPKHHGGSDDPFETIKVLEHWLTPDEMIGFCKGQSIVYQRRHRAKGGLTDLAKAAWYSNYLVKYLVARNLSGYGPTSVLPLKPGDKPREVPPGQQPVASQPQLAPQPGTSDTAGAAGDRDPQPDTEPLQPADPGLGAGAAAESAAFPGSLEHDIASLAAMLSPTPREDQVA